MSLLQTITTKATATAATTDAIAIAHAHTHTRIELATPPINPAHQKKARVLRTKIKPINEAPTALAKK